MDLIIYKMLVKIVKNLFILRIKFLYWLIGVHRIINFDLNPDRSDVIIPAAEIFLKTLEWSGSSEIYVPKVGLADGMVRLLYKKYGNNG